MHFTVYGRSRSTVWILQAVSSDFFHVSPFGTVFLPTVYWLPDHVLSKKLFLSSLYSCFLYFSPDLFPVTVLFQQLYRIFILKKRVQFTDLQNGGYHTEVYGRVHNVTSHTMSIISYYIHY